MVSCVGPDVAGDEKLFDFVGNSPFVIKKKGHLGFWMYELVACLPNGKPFLLHFDMWKADKVRGGSQPVVDIVKKWLIVLMGLSGGHPIGSSVTVGVTDSYYFSADSIAALFYNQKFISNIKFLIAATEGKYKYCVLLKNRVQTKGEWKALYNSKQKLTFVHYWDPLHNRKYVLSNAFIMKNKKQKKGEIPVSDHYSATFGRADNFNTNLVQKTWPFKHGGKGAFGEAGTEHDFAMSSVLQNTFNG